MATKVQKWGNSLAVRLPKEVIRRLALKEGSDVMVRERNERIIIEPLEEQREQRKDAWNKLLLPTGKKKENVSEYIDRILYGATKDRS